MSQSLPTGCFRFLKQREIDEIEWSEIDDNADKGYMVEVDLSYPEHLHHHHNDLPLAPERIVVKEEFLSPYQLELKNKMGIKGNSSVAKLVPNFNKKVKYVTHYRNLKLYLRLGLKLERVHRVIEFSQSAWIKPYVDFNTKRRQKATSSSEKDFYKFMNNSLFGKTMQNLRIQQNIKLVQSVDRALTLFAKPNFKSFTQVHENLLAIKLTPAHIRWNKPTFTGACVLDLSKVHMYKFHYDVMKKMYGNNLRLLFTDTDSLCYHIKTHDLYDDMKSFIHHLDTSNFPKDHPCFSLANDRKLGYFKDECASLQAREFVGLRAKMYSLLMPEGQSDKATAKGIKKSYAKKKLKHEKFVACLNGERIERAEFYTIRSKNHNLSTSLVVSKV